MRSYGDPCGVARALDLIGERWALLIVRELLLGPKRFTDLREGLPHVSADVLSQRLRELEAAGVLRRDKLPPPAGSRIYELTGRGRELEPLVLELGRWGSRSAMPDTDMELGVDAFVIALKTLFDPELAPVAPGTYELGLGDQRFTVDVTEAAMTVVRGRAEHPRATIESDPATLAEVMWHGRPYALGDTPGTQPGRPLGESGLRISGDREAAQDFLALFPAPRPLAAPD